ncbi:hypothetical protein BDR06DRAFT_355397 [Suillus hirtellus]|nr:hypothetical protein BDR06DRAFT_355397 [Suillus hirtellus]
MYQCSGRKTTKPFQIHPSLHHNNLASMLFHPTSLFRLLIVCAYSPQTYLALFPSRILHAKSHRYHCKSNTARRPPAGHHRAPISTLPVSQRLPPKIDPQQSISLRLRKILRFSSHEFITARSEGSISCSIRFSCYITLTFRWPSWTQLSIDSLAWWQGLFKFHSVIIRQGRSKRRMNPNTELRKLSMSLLDKPHTLMWSV